jgi:hypothetical protein
MRKPKTYLIYACLLVIFLSCACSSQKSDVKNGNSNSPSLTDSASIPKELIAVSFTKADGTPFSSRFRISKASWMPGAASTGSSYTHTEHRYCLTGRSEVPDQQPSHSLSLCFSINEDVPYNLIAEPVRPDIYLIGQLESGRLSSKEKDKITGLGITVRKNTFELKEEFNVQLKNIDGQGYLRITTSEKKRVAGQFNIGDSNITVVGSFDCPIR